MEQSPVGSSASNGIAERAILSIQQQVRVMKSAIEGRWGVKLETRHPMIPWMIEHAAVLLNRFEVGRDGKTAFERNKGKKATTVGIEFGEAILWKKEAERESPREAHMYVERGYLSWRKGELRRIYDRDGSGSMDDKNRTATPTRGQMEPSICETGWRRALV